MIDLLAMGKSGRLRLSNCRFSVCILVAVSALASARADVPQHPKAAPDTAKAAAAAPTAKDSIKVHVDSVKTTEDSVYRAADSINGQRFYEYIAYPVLQILTWPAEAILVPAVKFAIYPSKAPLRYMMNENVIDRTLGLISFGHDNKTMLYPTLNLAPGTSSSTGLTLRVKSIFGRPTENAVAQGNLYVNGDWKFRTYLTASQLFGTGFSTKYSLQLNRVKNMSVNQPGTNRFWMFADTSNVLSTSLSHHLIESFGLKGTFVFRDNHYGTAPPQEDKLESPFFKDKTGAFDPQFRGLNQDWQDRITAVGIYRDTRNNENIPLAGSNFTATYHRHFTTVDHDFQGWESLWDGYFKLGKERYEITPEEERMAGKMSMRKVLEKMEYEKLKKELLNRKVLALHAYAAQSFELPGNTMPVYGLQTLGNDTPMRGYAGSRFRDYTVASLSAEYRFPVLRLVDGVMFNEYGVYGRSWDKIEYLDNLKNSWGFGIRVRRPDIYLFRAQLGFHGLHGIQLNMSVDEPF
jgi:hypothetical protein